MSENPAEDYRGRPLRRGSRVMRIRSMGRTPWQGQPDRPVTHPSIRHQETEAHVCAECFGVRSRYRKGPFCTRCERDLFGDATMGDETFIRSERARQTAAARKRKARQEHSGE